MGYQKYVQNFSLKKHYPFTNVFASETTNIALQLRDVKSSHDLCGSSLSGCAENWHSFLFITFPLPWVKCLTSQPREVMHPYFLYLNFHHLEVTKVDFISSHQILHFWILTRYRKKKAANYWETHSSHGGRYCESRWSEICFSIMNSETKLEGFA